MPYLFQHKDMENFLESLLRDHKRYLPIVEMLDTIIQNASELSWIDCERIGFELGRQNGSEFCAGIRSGMMNALDADKVTTGDDRFRSLLAFARKLNNDSSTINEVDIQAIRDAGWNDQTIEDVAGLVAILKVYSMLANGFGFGELPESTFAELGAATVQMNGYTAVFQSYIDQTHAAQSA